MLMPSQRCTCHARCVISALLEGLLWEARVVIPVLQKEARSRRGAIRDIQRVFISLFEQKMVKVVKTS